MAVQLRDKISLESRRLACQFQREQSRERKVAASQGVAEARVRQAARLRAVSKVIMKEKTALIREAASVNRDKRDGVLANSLARRT